MPKGSASRLAWLLVSASALLVVAGLTLLLLTLDYPPKGGWGFRGFPAIFAIESATLGWLIMTRRPENRVGLLLAIIGLLNATQLFLTEYAAAAARTGLPVGDLAGLVNAFVWVPTLGLMAGATPLLFPDGRLPSARWRVVAAFLAIGSIGVMMAIFLFPDALNTPREVRSPVSVPIDDSTLNAMAFAALYVMLAGIVASGASLVSRWRRSSGVVHEQLKWLALSVSLLVAALPLSLLPQPIASTIFIAVIATIPLAIGLAVLRYRLYEIDTFISRTVVFGALTAILTGLFAALQKLLQTVFVAATGNESDAALVITTLILATSFTPLKHAIERVVERRFSDRRTIPSPEADSASPGVLVIGGTPGWADPAALETILRRVVREEVRAAIGGVPAGSLDDQDRARVGPAQSWGDDPD